MANECKCSLLSLSEKHHQWASYCSFPYLGEMEGVFFLIRFFNIEQSRRTTVSRCGCRSTAREQRKRHRAQAPHNAYAATLLKRALKLVKKRQP